MSVAKRGASGLRELTRVGDRVSFVYLERCVVHRDANAITAEDADGVRHIPSATIGTLLLGPGTRITHDAMRVLGDTGTGVIWVGEHGVRYYSGGRALSRSARLAQAQAVAWANRRSRLDVARAMYKLRFPDDDPAGCTRGQLFSKESARVKKCYREHSRRTGVPWNGRKYMPGDFTSGDPPNQGVTAAAQCLYGVAQSVVAALGLSPALGFVHSGHELSFVMDIADLYKTELAIPVAFDVAAENGEDVGARTRRAIRDRIHTEGLLERCVEDIKGLLIPAGEVEPEEGADMMWVQTDRGPERPAGYSDPSAEEEWGDPWEVVW